MNVFIKKLEVIKVSEETETQDRSSLFSTDLFEGSINMALKSKIGLVD
jgi:hypothetical protein